MIKRSNRGKLSGSLGGKALPGMRKGVQRKRSLWSLVTVAVAIALVGLFTVGVGVSYADTQDLLAPVHHKTIEKHLVNGNWDGTYDLKLTVKGDSVGSTETNPVDIVVVFDTSYSMNYSYDGRSNTTRLAMAKQALTNQKGTGLLDKVLGSDGPDGVRVSLVTFATQASTNSRWYDKNSAKALKRTVGSISADGGTNWEDALIKAKNLLDNDKRDGVQKYVVFLSDGDPTQRVSDGVAYEYWYGQLYEVTNPDDNDNPDGVHGNGLKDDYPAYDANGYWTTFHWNYDAAAKAAESFKMDSKHFFSVKIATEAEKMDNLERDATKDSSVPGTSALDGTTPSNLSSAFGNIVTEITHAQTYTNVTITDTLSNDAEIVPGTTPKVSKTDEKNLPSNLPSGNPASVSDNGSTVSWTIQEEGTKDLEKGATYTLSINVRPTQNAYDRAMSGDYDTDSNGIFSNDNAKTSLSYSTVKYTDGKVDQLVQHDSLPYEQPVMEIPLSSITVKKVWDPEKSALGSATVKLQWKVENGEWADVKDENGNVRTLELNNDNGWTGKFKNIAAGPDGHEYQVVEMAPSDSNAWTTTYKYTLGNHSYYTYEGNKSSANEGTVTLAGRQAQSANAIVTNKQHTLTLKITKTVGGNFGDRSQSFGFTLNLKDASGKPITDAAKTANGLNGGTDGKYTFSLTNGKSVSITVPYGTNYTVVEDDLNNGIAESNPDYYHTTVAVNGSGSVSNKDRSASSAGMTADTTVTYTNSRTVNPGVGVDLGSGAPYVAVIGGIGIAGVIWMALKRRNSQGI